MASDIIITGLKREDCPVVYDKVKLVGNKFKLKKINVKINKKSKVMNAYALPFNRIRITQKLIDNMSEDEIETVIAHEFSHIYNRDLITILPLRFLFITPYVFFIFLALSFAIVYFTLPTVDVSVKIALFFLTLVTFSIGIFAGLYGTRIINWATTQMERRCDIEAALKTGKSKALKIALLKMYYSYFSSDKRPGILSQLAEGIGYIKDYYTGYTHPHTKERLEFLSFANEMVELINNDETKKQLEPSIAAIQVDKH